MDLFCFTLNVFILKQCHCGTAWPLIHAVMCSPCDNVLCLVSYFGPQIGSGGFPLGTS